MTARKSFVQKKLLILCLASFCAHLPALADSIWKGGTGDWGTASNWDAVPTAGTKAVLPSGTAVVSPTDLNVVNALSSIEVSSGATLKFVGTGFGGATLTARITGAGNFVAVDCGSSTSSKLTLNGDCSGFTGSLDFTNCYISVSTQKAIGSTNPVFVKSPAAKAFSLPNFTTFGNSFVLVGGGTQTLSAPYTVYGITGKVTTRGGWVGVYGGATKDYILTLKGGLHHDDSVTGTMNGTRITGFVRVQGDDLEHGVTGRDPNSAYPLYVDGTLYLKAPVKIRGLAYPGRISVGGTLVFEKNECFDHSDANWSPEIMFGSDVASMQGSGTVDLNGTTQTVNVIYFYKGASGNYHMTSGRQGGKLIMTQGGSTFYAPLEGCASFEYDSTLAMPGTVSFKKASNPTSGGLHAKCGTIEVAEGIAFPNLTLLKASNTGVLDVHSASFPQSVDLELSDTASLSVSGDTLIVRSATVDGEPVGLGLHEAGEDGAFGARLTSGSVKVLTGPVEVQTSTWTGKGSDANLTTAANWDRAPDFTLPESVRLVFGANASRAVVDDKLAVNAVVINGSGFALEGADATSTLEIRKGGIQMSNPNASGVVTNTIAVPLVFINTDSLNWHENDWTFGERICARFTGTLSGGSVNSSTCLGGPTVISESEASGETATTAPLIEVVAANGTLDTALVFSNVLLHAYEPTSLGAATRYTTLHGNFWRPFATCAANTNATPLRLRGGATRDLGAEGVPFVQTGALTSYGSMSVRFSDTLFTGGIGNEYVSSGYPYPWGFYPSAGTMITIREKPISVPGKHVMLGNGTLCLDVANNAWTQFLFKGNDETLVCGVDNALPSTTHLYFDSTGSVRHYLLLNGHDQTIQRAYGLNAAVEGDNENRLEVHSTSPATLKFIGEGSNFVVPIAFVSNVRFHWAGTGIYTLCNFVSKSTNGLEVSSGTLGFKWGAGFINATNVTVRGTGTLKIDETSAGDAFGDADSRAELVIADSGKLDLPADKTVRVFKLNANGVGQRHGTYAREGIAADFNVPWITGDGVLHVRKTSGSWGLMLLVR